MNEKVYSVLVVVVGITSRRVVEWKKMRTRTVARGKLRYILAWQRCCMYARSVRYKPYYGAQLDLLVTITTCSRV